MIFWIALVVILVIAIIIAIGEGDGESGFFVFVALMCFATIFTGGMSASNSTTTETGNDKVGTSQLRSLGTASETEGRFYFLGGGYIDEQRTLNFITQDEITGGNYVRSVAADDSVIFEDSSEAPRLETWESSVTKTGDTFWFPFTFPSTKTVTTYKFYIPEESILNDYTISN